MSMTVNNSSQAINWESLLNAINGGDSAVQSATVDSASKTLTFTIADQNGAMREVSASIPALELPETVDAAAIDSLTAKLTELSKAGNLGLSEAEIKDVHKYLMDGLAAVSEKGSIKVSKSVMFDIYALMALLVEVAQKQRDATREMRLAENLSVQSAIKAQAAEQKKAAQFGFWGALACCGAQALCTGVTMYKMGSAFKDQLGALKTSDIASAKQNYQMMKAVESPNTAHRQLESAQSKIGNPANHELKADVDAKFQRVTDAEAKITAIDEKVAADTRELNHLQEVQEGRAEINPDTLPAGDLKDAVNSHNAVKQRVMTEIENDTTFGPSGTKHNNAVKEYVELKSRAESGVKLSPAEDARVKDLEGFIGSGRTKAAQAKIAQITEAKSDIRSKVNARVETLKKEIEGAPAAKEDARLALKKEVEGMVSLYETKHSLALNEYETAPKAQKAAAELEVENSAKQLEYARALGYDKLSGKVGDMNVTTDLEKTQLLKFAQDRVAVATNQTTGTNLKYLKAAKAFAKGEMFNMLVNALGNGLQSMVSNWAQMHQADATAKGALSQKAQEDLDQTKDLFGQAQTLVNQVIQLMQAVIQAESQSMRDAIHA